mmetsp:Transcript_11203/g.69176  ORF Transcript_11203/g.69176 Transcript_11203/m.69176 type:complete len:327 (-) Transcript_11203:238-1218(-)
MILVSHCFDSFGQAGKVGQEIFDKVICSFCCPFEEPVFEQFGRRGPFHWIFLQAQGHKFSQRFAECLVFGLLERGRWVLQGHHQHLHGRVPCKGCMSVGELEDGDAEGPYVGMEIIPHFCVHHFRRHPARGANERKPGSVSAPRPGPFDGGGDPKVRQLHLSTGINEYVSGFDVPVYHAIFVQVFQSFEHFTEHGGDKHFVQSFGIGPLHDVQQRSCSDVRHDHPQLHTGHEAAVQGQKVGMVHVLHGLGFSLDLVLWNCTRRCTTTLVPSHVECQRRDLPVSCVLSLLARSILRFLLSFASVRHVCFFFLLLRFDFIPSVRIAPG